MPRAYSLDLRERVFGACQRGDGSQREVAARFGVSERFVRGVVHRQRESGSVAAKAHGGGRVALATPASLAALRAQVAARHDDTIAEHHQSMLAAGFALSAATIGRMLLALRQTRKKRRCATTRHKASACRHYARRGRSGSPESGPKISSSWTRAGSTAR